MKGDSRRTEAESYKFIKSEMFLEKELEPIVTPRLASVYYARRSGKRKERECNHNTLFIQVQIVVIWIFRFHKTAGCL